MVKERQPPLPSGAASAEPKVPAGQTGPVPPTTAPAAAAPPPAKGGHTVPPPPAPEPAAAPVRTCSSCHWWREKEAGLGACHRYPPAGGMQRATAGGPLMLPIVTPQDFDCGEHKPRE